MASIITPSRAPWRSSPESRPIREPLLGRGRPAEQSGHLPPPLGLRPWSGEAADPLEGGVDLGHGQRRGAAGSGASRRGWPSRPRSGAAGSSPARKATAGWTSSGSSRRRQAARPLHLGQAGGAGGDGGGRLGNLVEQHGAILPTSRRPAQGAGPWRPRRVSFWSCDGLDGCCLRPPPGVGAGWAVAELARPRRTDIRVFDPDDVARLETAMWRSYYDRRRLPLFGQLVALLQGQFHFQPLWAVALAGLPPGRPRSSRWARATTTTGAPPTWKGHWLPQRSGRRARSSTRGGRLGRRWSGGSRTASSSTRPATWSVPWPTWRPSSTRSRPNGSGPTPAAGPRP